MEGLLFAGVDVECEDDKLFRFYLKALTGKASEKAGFCNFLCSLV